MLTEQLGLHKNVRFFGALKDTEILNLYSEAHIFVLPSITSSTGGREGQGLVIQEAQACGLPVIATLGNGIAEGVSEAGLLVPEKNVEALTRKIMWLIENHQSWPEIGRIGREFVESRYDIKILSRRLAEIYSNLLNDDYDSIRKAGLDYIGGADEYISDLYSHTYK